MPIEFILLAAPLLTILIFNLLIPVMFGPETDEAEQDRKWWSAIK